MLSKWQSTSGYTVLWRFYFYRLDREHSQNECPHKSSFDKNFEIALTNKPEITKRNPMRNMKNYLLIISLTLTLISACTESVHQTEQSLESLDKEHLKKLEALVNPNQSTEFSLSVLRSEFIIIATGITTKVVNSSSNK